MASAGVHVVSHKAIRSFCEEHPHARNAMDYWYRVAKRAIWTNFADLRQSFNMADFVAPHVVFDIGGNKYRIIAEMNFTRKLIFIRRIMTHKEYERGAWKS
jgi:mRNA interferase HigB